MNSPSTAVPRTNRPRAAPLLDALGQLVSAGWRPGLLLALLFAMWWFVTMPTAPARLRIAPYLVPAPALVGRTLVDQRDYLARHTKVTLIETVAGFVLAMLLGLVAAVAIVYSPTAEKTLYPILLFAQVIPKISIAPLFVVWLGVGMAPKILVAILIAFFPIVISAVTGLRQVDAELLDLAATMGASRWKEFVKIRFPSALPFIFSGLKVAVTLAVVGAVVGEFVGANEGLGFVLLTANGNLDSALLFATLIVMSGIGIVLFVLIEAAERLLLPWHSSRRTGIAITA